MGDSLFHLDDLLPKFIPSSIFHFSLSKFELFNLREIYFSVWYLFIKILLKWVKDGFISLQRHVQRYDFPKISI